ncbi:MAG: tetratricopeptide repeat protein [Pyrinomonadaceae bacterium]
MTILNTPSTLLFTTAIVLLTILNFSSAAQVKPKSPSLRSISISSQPNAKVWINGVLYGTTSKTGTLGIKTVSPGRKSIRVRADGFKEAQKILRSTQSGPISIPLTKTTDEAELTFQNAERLASVDREKAAAAYELAAELHPGYTNALIGLARVSLDAGDFERALKAIAAVRKSQPGSAEASAIEGRILRSIGEETAAIAAFDRAIKEGNGFQPEAYAGLGLLYMQRAENAGAGGEFDEESANYGKAAENLSVAIKQLSGAPDAVVLYQFLGLVYEQQKKFDDAIAVYREFLTHYPGHAESTAFESFIVQLRKQMEKPE